MVIASIFYLAKISFNSFATVHLAKIVFFFSTFHFYTIL